MPKKSLFLLICVFISTQSLTAQNTQQKRPPKKYVYISIRPGISLDHIRMKGYFKEDVKFNNAGKLCFAGVLDFDYDGVVIFRTEVTYKPMHFHTEGGGGENNTFNTYELKGFSMIPEFQLLFKKLLNSNLNIYGGGGFGYRFSKVLKNEVTFVGNSSEANSLKVETSDGVVSCAIGLIYCSRYELNCKLSVTQWGNSSLDKLTNRFISIGICYRL